jgi:hypothetical protein
MDSVAGCGARSSIHEATAIVTTISRPIQGMTAGE